MSFFARFLAFLARIAGGARGAMLGAYSWLASSVEEAVEPVTRRLPWLRDRAEAAGNGLVAGAGYGAIAAAALVRAPGAVLREVGSIVGSILPAPALTPQAVADDAVAQDDTTAPSAPTGETPIFGLFIHGAAQALQTGGEAAFARHVDMISEPVASWLRSLSPRDLAVAVKLGPHALQRHINAEGVNDGHPMLPSYRAHSAEAAAAYADATVDAMLAQARRNRLGELREVAAMSVRGARPLPEPTWDDEPSYAPTTRYAH